MMFTPTHTPNRFQRLAPATGAIALVMGSMWVANQGGVVPDSAEAAEKFFGTIYQGVRSMTRLMPVWLGVLGLGLPLRVWLVPKARHRITMQLCLGMGAMLMLDWILAACGWLNGWTAWSVCGLGTAVITYHFADGATRDRWHPDQWPAPPWSVLLALPALGLLLVACTMPPGTMWAIEAFGYDVTSYHLEVPREWLELGQMRSLDHNVYSHLPMFVEAGYMKLAVLHGGSMYDAIYTTQFFHASAAVLAAAVMGRLISGISGPVAGAIGGAALLATPWTLVTGSLPYNEMFVLLFGAAAIAALFDPLSSTPRGALVVGIFCGLATLAKPTAGGFIALPIGAAMIGWHLSAIKSIAMNKGAAPPPLPPADGSASLEPARIAPLLALTILGGCVILTPYLVRNTIWTGNPVFPFAAGVFGSAHWSPELTERWNKAHHAPGVVDGLEKLPRQWLLNTGFGAIGGSEADPRQATDVARFDAEFGLPILWIMAGAGAAILLLMPGRRRFAAALCIILFIQILFWILATHHQSRFLVPTLLPGCILLGVGVGRIAALARGKADWLAPALGITTVLCLTLTSFGTFLRQARSIVDSETNQLVNLPPYLLVDSLVDPNDATSNQPGRFAGRHPLNQLPFVSTTLLVGDANQVLYIRRRFAYNTAFDRSMLARLIKDQKGNAQAVTSALVRAGFTHVWINFAELSRLHQSYGIDPEITPQIIDELRKLWTQVPELAGERVPRDIGLYALPRRPATPAPTSSPAETQGKDAKADEKKIETTP
jgi:hypothetical protein